MDHRIPAAPTTPITLPAHHRDRYHQLARLQGLRIIHITPHRSTEGRLIAVARPDLTDPDPAPTLTLDTIDGETLIPGRAGDLLAALD